MENKKPISFDEFFKSCYHTEYHLHIPLIDRIKVDKRDFFVKGKYNSDKLKEKLYEIYEQNLDRLK